MPVSYGSTAAGLAAFLLGATLPVAKAADANPELDAVYVYGQSLEATLPQELAEYGSDLVSLGRATIEENAYPTPQLALQMEVPGVYIAPAGPFSYSQISIQGSRTANYGPSDVLWLVDGVRLNNRLYPSTLSDTLPANMVERIEVLKGGESLFYGTGAAGGVINIVSRDFSDEFGGDVSVGGDTNSSWSAAGMVRGPAGPGNFVLFGSRDESTGYRLWDPVEPSATDRKQGYEVTNFGGKYGWDLTSDLRIVGQYQHTEGQIDFLRPRRTSRGFNERNEEIASVRVDYAPDQGPQFSLKGYYHDWDSFNTEYWNVIGSPGDTIDLNEDYGGSPAYWGYKDYGINALSRFRPGKGSLEYLLGYDFQRYNARDDVWHIDPATERVHAVYGQVRTSESLIENGALSAGVRYNEAGSTSATVWNVSGKYNFAGSMYVQGSVSTNFILPSAEQLYLMDCCEVGNPDLEPEEATNFNASIGAVEGRRYWQATGFWRKIKDYIAVDYNQVAYPDGIFNNLGEAKITGFELLGGLPLTESVHAEASYTHVRARVNGLDLTRERMDYIPSDHANASVTLDRHRFGGSLAARWVGDVDVYVNGTFGVVNYGNYVVADLSAFLYLDQGRRHQVVARLENMLDEESAALRGVASNALDDGSGSFLSTVRGVPRTLRFSYRYRF